MQYVLANGYILSVKMVVIRVIVRQGLAAVKKRGTRI